MVVMPTPPAVHLVAEEPDPLFPVGFVTLVSCYCFIGHWASVSVVLVTSPHFMSTGYENVRDCLFCDCICYDFTLI